MHPLSGDLKEYSDSELEQRIISLTNKYMMTNNIGIKTQITMLLMQYNEELAMRRQAQWESSMASHNKSFDKLINIS